MTRNCLGISNGEWRPFLARFCSSHLLPQFVLPNNTLTLVDLGRLAQQLDSGNAAEVLDVLLSPQEQQLYAGFSYPKRRVEWLGGRLAAKGAIDQLLGKHGPMAPKAISILPDDVGIPVVKIPFRGIAPVRVSISHSGEYAASVASKNTSCGVDIQCVSDRLLKVQERFVSGNELVFLDKEPNLLTRLGMLWTAKEAMKKCFFAADPIFFGKLQLVGARRLDQAQWLLHCRMQEDGTDAVQVHVALFSHYSLACVQGGENA